jgi:hypothetical protein
MIGRKTSGGFVITSRPPRSPFTVSATGDALALGLVAAEGDEVGTAEADGAAGGVGVGGPCSVKLAHGRGGTLAQRRCTPGLSPGNGTTGIAKLPLESA